MAKKLGSYQTPTGATGNVFSINSWVSMILGGLVLIISFATAQNLAKFIGGRVPGVDTQVDKPYAEPAAPSNTKQAVYL